MGTPLAEILEFPEQCREVGIRTDRITVDDDGVPDHAVRDHAVDCMAEVELLVILQRKVGAAVLAVQIQQCPGMLQVGRMTRRWGQPWAEGIDDGRQDAEPAEPEHAELEKVGGVRQRDGACIAQQNPQAVLQTVEEGMTPLPEKRT